MFEISNEDRLDILNEFDSIVTGLVQDSTSAQDFTVKADTVATETATQYSDDGINPDIITPRAQDYYNYLYDGYCNTGDEALLKQISDYETEYSGIQYTGFSTTPPKESYVSNQVAVNKAEADKVYYKNSLDSLPATENSFAVEMQNAFKQAYKKPPADWMDKTDIIFNKATYDSGGSAVSFTQSAQRVDWGRQIDEFGHKNVEDNILSLKALIAKYIDDNIGFNRITHIAVRSDQLIVNGVCCIPVLEPKYLTSSVFPLDSLDYIKNGLIAPLFDWSYLKDMPNLAVLDIDSTQFYLTVVASDLGVGRRAGLTTIFRCIKSLETFILNGREVAVSEQTTDNAREVKEEIAKYKHFLNLGDGYELRSGLLRGTNSFQSWTVNNLKSYANARGNKSLFHYTGGLIGRTLMATVGVGLNLGTHIIGKVGRGVLNVFRDATNTVKDN